MAPAADGRVQDGQADREGAVSPAAPFPFSGNDPTTCQFASRKETHKTNSITWGIVMGVAIGAGLGAAMGNTAIGIAICIAAGAAVGAGVHYWRNRADR